MAMASNSKLSYQRLKHEFPPENDDYNVTRNVIFGRSALRTSRLGRTRTRRRLRVRIPSLKRFLRRKAKVVRIAWAKIYKRLKESRAHFGDLFAGNYLFMQVTPTPLKCEAKIHGFSSSSSSRYSYS